MNSYWIPSQPYPETKVLRFTVHEPSLLRNSIRQVN
uniref:Uncharacterized protein n=1 Tax=Rhizophora mucronata TaxID=61149 RepID=A0A2P2IHS5_RHIMU